MCKYQHGRGTNVPALTEGFFVPKTAFSRGELHFDSILLRCVVYKVNPTLGVRSKGRLRFDKAIPTFRGEVKGEG